MSNNTKFAQKVYDISSQFDLDNCEDISEYVGSTDVTAIAASTTHVTGAGSISFAKSGTTEAFGYISKTFTSNTKNANIFSQHKVRLLINLSALTNISSVSLKLGSSASNNNVYTTDVASLTTGWNELNYNCDSPTSIAGTGVNWYEIKYFEVRVTFGGAANTLTGILVDGIYFYKASSSGAVASDVNISQVNGATPDLAKNSVQTNGTQKTQVVDSNGSFVISDEQHATHWSPVHFTAAYTSASTITLTGAPTVSQNTQIIKVIVNNSGNQTKIIKNGFDGYSFGYVDSTGVLTIYKNSIASSEFVNTDQGYGVFIRENEIAMDFSSDAEKNIILNQDSEKRIDPVPLIDTTNVAAATNYYPSTAGASLDGFRHLNIQGVTSGGVTSTIEFTNDPAASPDWIDGTKAGYEVITNTTGNASFIDSTFALDYTFCNFAYFRVKSITSDATNAVQYSYRLTA